MIRHHPGDELLLPHAGGRLPQGVALLVRVHLEACEACRLRLRIFESLGGALLEQAGAAAMKPQAWAQTLARVDAQRSGPLQRPQMPSGMQATPPGLQMPANFAWPRALHGHAVSRWFWLGPGVRSARVKLQLPPKSAVYLLRIAQGHGLPRHSHRGQELTQVLCGRFDDGHAAYARRFRRGRPRQGPSADGGRG